MDALKKLIDALRCLPGVGPKSAQRMAYYLLQHQRSKGIHLAFCLQNAMEKIKHCKRCNNYTEMEYCQICQDSSRDHSLLCIVETPSDITAIEQTQLYKGTYFVLMGKISPIDGIGPEDLGLSRLVELVKNNSISEVILALSPSIEGQTTVHFIWELLSKLPLRISQLAHGIPSGGELELLDATTIGSALRNRAVLNE